MNKQFSQSWLIALLSMALGFFAVEAQTRKPGGDSAKSNQRLTQITYNTVKIDSLDIFYREAGEPSKPTILLLHGFPTSSHMFRNLIPALADRFHLVAPDYPGFGQSSALSTNEFNYTFDNLANVIDKFTNIIGLKSYSLYVQDYGAPVGYRLAVKNPEKVRALIVQNGNAYEEGLGRGQGFLGVAVALLAGGRPAAIIGSALVFGVLAHGGLSVVELVPKELVDVLQAAVVLVAAGFVRARIRAGHPRSVAQHGARPLDLASPKW